MGTHVQSHPGCWAARGVLKYLLSQKKLGVGPLSFKLKPLQVCTWGIGLVACAARWPSPRRMPFHTRLQAPISKWSTSILTHLGLPECWGLMGFDLANIGKNNDGKITVFDIHMHFSLFLLRSGGPSLKSSAEYPQEFASWVADQHSKVLASCAEWRGGGSHSGHGSTGLTTVPNIDHSYISISPIL